jgi:hypothetical protein
MQHRREARLLKKETTIKTRITNNDRDVDTPDLTCIDWKVTRLLPLLM